MIEKILLECMQNCFLATAFPPSLQKTQAVAIASAQFDTLKVYLRLALDNNSLTEKVYLGLFPRLGTIGNMLGGWIKETQKYQGLTGQPKPNPNLLRPPQP